MALWCCWQGRKGHQMGVNKILMFFWRLFRGRFVHGALGVWESVLAIAAIGPVIVVRTETAELDSLPAARLDFVMTAVSRATIASLLDYGQKQCHRRLFFTITHNFCLHLNNFSTVSVSSENNHNGVLTGYRSRSVSRSRKQNSVIAGFLF